MPKNINSSSGMAEDLVRAFIQMGCSELHLKTLYEKTLAEMENGIADMSDADVRKKYIDKANRYRDDLIETAQIRRRMMLKCFELFDDGDKDVWCMVKHLGISAMCAFETWQASDDDDAMLDIAIDANKMFTKYLSAYVGMEITNCASCVSDYLKGKENEL